MVRHLMVTTEGADRSVTGVRSVYALVGSCLTERAETDEPILTEMISSFTVTAGIALAFPAVSLSIPYGLLLAWGCVAIVVFLGSVDAEARRKRAGQNH